MLRGEPKISRDQDHFGWKGWWESLGDVILEQPREQLPINVGIFGPWGCGKTSFMHFVEEYIKEKAKEENNSLKTLWFFPWRYDRKQDLVSAFMFHLIKNIESDKGATARIKDKAKGIGIKILKFGARATAITGERLLGGSIPVTGLAEDAWETAFKVQSEFHDITETLLTEVCNLIGEWAVDGKVVVFVDDLDRCLPEHTIQLLEALKLFLNEAPCVFVVGADRTVIEQAIRQHYHMAEKFTEREYLDKIVHLPFNLPPVTAQNIQTAYGSTLNEIGILSDRLLQPLFYGFGTNPRHYERFINLYPLLTNLADKTRLRGKLQDARGEGREEIRALLITVAVLRIRFPRVFEIISSNPIAIEIFSSWCYKTSDRNKQTFHAAQIAELYPYFEVEAEVRQFFKKLGTAWQWDTNESFNPFDTKSDPKRYALLAQAFGLMP